MPPLVKDYLEYRKIEYQPVIDASNLADCLRTFLPTDGLVELLNRLLESIYKKLGEDAPTQEPSSILLAGGHGVGKSHLLAVIYSLVSQKGTLAAGLHDPRVQLPPALVEDADTVAPSDDVRRRAGRLVATHPLRAADAFQLAAALIWCEEQPGGEAFVCLDERLREAARREGVTLVPE